MHTRALSLAKQVDMCKIKSIYCETAITVIHLDLVKSHDKGQIDRSIMAIVKQVSQEKAAPVIYVSMLGVLKFVVSEKISVLGNQAISQVTVCG